LLPCLLHARVSDALEVGIQGQLQLEDNRRIVLRMGSVISSTEALARCFPHASVTLHCMYAFEALGSGCRSHNRTADGRLATVPIGVEFAEQVEDEQASPEQDRAARWCHW